MLRAAIKKECSGSDISDVDTPVSSLPPFDSLDDSQLLESVNEWRLLHGTSFSGCESICRDNFRLKLAGTGATWKEKGKAVGEPLYGFGIYLAERSTKADEYAKPTEAVNVDGEPSELHSLLVCRVVAGRCQVVLTNEFVASELKEMIYDGPYHSVFGDRVKTLKKPYREIVIYDKDQIYPEFVVLYQRTFEGDPLPTPIVYPPPDETPNPATLSTTASGLISEIFSEGYRSVSELRRNMTKGIFS